MHEAFYGKYIVHAQAVCTRPLLGGERPGDEANLSLSGSCFLLFFLEGVLSEDHLDLHVNLRMYTISSHY